MYQHCKAAPVATPLDVSIKWFHWVDAVLDKTAVEIKDIMTEKLLNMMWNPKHSLAQTLTHPLSHPQLTHPLLIDIIQTDCDTHIS